MGVLVTMVLLVAVLGMAWLAGMARLRRSLARPLATPAPYASRSRPASPNSVSSPPLPKMLSS